MNTVSSWKKLFRSCNFKISKLKPSIFAKQIFQTNLRYQIFFHVQSTIFLLIDTIFVMKNFLDRVICCRRYLDVFRVFGQFQWQNEQSPYSEDVVLTGVESSIFIFVLLLLTTHPSPKRSTETETKNVFVIIGSALDSSFLAKTGTNSRTWLCYR